MAQGKKVVLGVCGSIAAYKAGEIIRRLRDEDCDVTVVMTREAAQFITPLTLASLSGKDVSVGLFEGNAPAWSSQGIVGRMAHIDLAKFADVFLVAPATANVIGKLANGLADDLVTTLAITTRAPILIAPAMNEEMYANVFVKENCAKLKTNGAVFIEPVKGKLACGSVGIGHLADVEDIVKAVLKA